jgi:alpha-D-xyloside xylohydrolase
MKKTIKIKILKSSLRQTMKRSLLFLLTLLPALAFTQMYKKCNLQKDHLSIQLSEGALNITPLSDKAIRVQWEKGMKEEREFVLINKLPAPSFQFSETSSKLKLITKAITVLFDKETGANKCLL